MIVYVETSAAAKLMFDEADSLELKRQLDDLAAGEIPLFSSAILETELRRAATREGVAQHAVTQILDRFNVIELDSSVFRAAGLLPGEHLRSLDALHIAAALRVGADVMVTYDQRQIDAAREVGLHTLSPGREAQPGAARV